MKCACVVVVEAKVFTVVTLEGEVDSEVETVKEKSLVIEKMAEEERELKNPQCQQNSI